MKTATTPESVLCDSCSMLTVMESNMNRKLFHTMSSLSSVVLQDVFSEILKDLYPMSSCLFSHSVLCDTNAVFFCTIM